MKSIISSKALAVVINSEKNNKGADFTMKSIGSGKEYTYKIKRSSFNDRWYTHVFVEKEYQNFVRLGIYFDGKIVNKKSEVHTPSADAIAFVLDKVQKAKIEYLDERLEIMHTGNCLKCGRVLTDSESIENGLGPICISK